MPVFPEFAYLAASIAAVMALVFALRTTRSASRQKVRAEAADAQRRIDQTHRATLLELGAHALAGGSTDAIGRDAAMLTRQALGADHCAVLELRRAGGPLVVAAAAGWDTGAVDGLTLTADVDTQAGYALHARVPVVVTDADAPSRFTVPAALRTRGVRSSVAARISALNRPFAVLLVSSTAPRDYTAEELQFVSGAASILAGMYERKRLEQECAGLSAREESYRGAAELASRRATFLAQTATVLDTALEPDATLVSLARLAVPALAECAVVDRVHDEGGVVRRVEVVDIDPARRESSAALRRQPPDLRSEGPLSRAIRTGQPALISQLTGERTDAEPERERLMEAMACQSLLLIPLVARGLTLGLLTLASRERRYEAADLAVAQELASRAAIALDNARLYREAQAASGAKDDFLATVSHELRASINAVLGWTAILRQHRLDATRAGHAAMRSSGAPAHRHASSSSCSMSLAQSPASSSSGCP